MLHIFYELLVSPDIKEITGLKGNFASAHINSAISPAMKSKRDLASNEAMTAQCLSALVTL